MSATALSFLLNGKRILSRRAAQKILAMVSLSPEEIVALQEWSTTPRKKRLQLKEPIVSTPQKEVNAHQLSLDSFSFISDWYHYAILSLLEIPGARFESKWISRRLGITEIEAKNAIDRLQRMGIVAQVDCHWRQVSGPIRIGNNVPTSATKKFHKQLLQKALASLENDPAEIRDFSSMTLAMDAKNVPYAKEQIRNFRRKLAEELEARSVPTHVYKFSVQIFPVTQSLNEEKPL